MSETVLLVDGDIIVYSQAAAAEEAVDWGDGLWSTYADEDVAKYNLDQMISELQQDAKADRVVVTLSDNVNNWRKDIFPAYKSNRKDVKAPMVRKVLHQYVMDEYDAKWKPGLEADDVLGILATNPKIYPGARKVIASIDKDLKTIPTTVFRWAANKRDAEWYEVSEFQADMWFLTQALTGDTTDGYPGCPGIGIKRAELLLADVDPEDPNYLTKAWELVSGTFINRKLSADEALLQARLARILRHQDFNYKTGEPKLWLPPSP